MNTTDTAHRDPRANPDRWWWHQATLEEVRRIQDATRQQTNAAAVAGNLQFSRLDVTKYLRELITWGELVEADPAWDYLSLWIRLPD